MLLSRLLAIVEGAKAFSVSCMNSLLHLGLQTLSLSIETRFCLGDDASTSIVAEAELLPFQLANGEAPDAFARRRS
jgi:hypothetical protein